MLLLALMGIGALSFVIFACVVDVPVDDGCTCYKGDARCFECHRKLSDEGYHDYN